MAWLWKQGRPTLLAVVGLGFLGYKALHKDHEPMGQGQAGTGVRGAATARPPLTTPTPEATPTKSAFLGGLGITELATRVVKEVKEDGDEAEATLEADGDEEDVDLKKEDGDWKIDEAATSDL